MGELTGPVLGITLVLTSVFLPASFLPGITGQMFRQFALVIASTAIISALNALTLKPTQCALYLRPIAQGQADQLVLSRIQPRLCRGRGSLYRARALDGASSAADGLRVFRDRRHRRRGSLRFIRRRCCPWRIRATAWSSRSFPQAPRSRVCARSPPHRRRPEAVPPASKDGLPSADSRRSIPRTFPMSSPSM